MNLSSICQRTRLSQAQHHLQLILSWDGFLHINYPLQCLLPWPHHLIDDFHLRGHSYDLNQDLVVEYVVNSSRPRSAPMNKADHRGKATAIDAASTCHSAQTASGMNARVQDHRSSPARAIDVCHMYHRRSLSGSGIQAEAMRLSALPLATHRVAFRIH